jgi:FlaA1/EpsC-like NDP-sugar epimerase
MSQKHEPSQSSSTDGGEGAGHYKSGDGGHGGNYLKFLLMILTAGAVMYVVMYFNTYQFDHVYWSWTRFFMTMMSTATMAVIMLGFMLGMYKKKVVNLAIVGGAVVVFSLGLWLVRSQETIGDVAWMEAMIPHHSIAILTSERANIEDPRARELADEIIEAQKREIAEMKSIIADLESP